jgi:hypothetical protein
MMGRVGCTCYALINNVRRSRLRTQQLQFNKMNISFIIWTITNKGNTIENKEYHPSSYCEPQFTPQNSSTSFTWSSLCLNIQHITRATKEIYTFLVHTENKLCTFRWFICIIVSWLRPWMYIYCSQLTDPECIYIVVSWLGPWMYFYCSQLTSN